MFDRRRFLKVLSVLGLGGLVPKGQASQPRDSLQELAGLIRWAKRHNIPHRFGKQVSFDPPYRPTCFGLIAFGVESTDLHPFLEYDLKSAYGNVRNCISYCGRCYYMAFNGKEKFRTETIEHWLKVTPDHVEVGDEIRKDEDGMLRRKCLQVNRIPMEFSCKNGYLFVVSAPTADKIRSLYQDYLTQLSVEGLQ